MTTAPQTLGHHLRELRNRLIAVVLVFLVFAAAAYPFFDVIIKTLLAPLGKEQQLVYLTPGGAFGLMIQVCLYVACVFAAPVLMYNLYRFIMPAVKKATMKTALGYTLVSFLLALVGLAFSYFVTLPAALKFLTNFNLYHINPMLTVDGYLAFVMAYLIAGALLFQLPLVMLIINTGMPLSPKKLMSFQPYLLLGSFAIAAIITPTPDVLNQTLLALPIVVMYQLGVAVVMLRNKGRVPQQPAPAATPAPIVTPAPVVVRQETPPRQALPTATMAASIVRSRPPRRPRQAMDIFVPSR